MGPRRGATALALALLCRCATLAAGAGGSISGTQKVIQMLTDMAAKSKEEKAEEEVNFSKFKTWCTEEIRKVTAEIAKNAADIESLTAEIAALKAAASELESDVAQLNRDATKYDADMEKETAERKKEHEAFVAEEQDYGESVDALGRAITVLKAQDVDRTGASSALVELAKDSKLPSKVKSVVTAFVAMASNSSDPSNLDYKAPEAYGYEFQSGSIVDMLKKLEDEFRTKLGESQKEEMNSAHAYSMVMLDLKDSKENSLQDIRDKTAQMQRKLAKAGASSKQLTATESMKEANEKELKDMQTECVQKDLSFQEKQKLRAEEIEAIEKAVEILSSPEVAGAADKYLTLAQSKKSPVALIQADSRSSAEARAQGIRRRVRDFLQQEGHRLKSQGLSALADKIAADPFAKVKKLIDGMITRLLEEAKEDADHEGFCDTEMGKSKVTRTRLSEEIDALEAAVESGKATIMDLASSTEALTKEVADLTAAMAEATEFREKEKKTNALTVEDAKSAQRAIAAATKVLADFYKKAATATAFLQLSRKPEWGLKMGVKMGSDEWNSLANPEYKGSGDTGHKEGMQTFGATEKGQQSENEYGVLALLEVIQSDFANLEATTKAAEAESQSSYDEFMIQSKKSKAKKDKKIAMNDADKAAAESQMQMDISDLKATQDELIAAESYYERLVPQCIDKGMTFDERTKARESEMASLKEALAILDSPDIVTSA